MKKFRPRADFVLLHSEDNGEEKTLPSGLVIPGNVAPDPRALRRGKVVAVGPGRLSMKHPELRLPMSVVDGDVVLFTPVFSGVEKKGGNILPPGHLLLREECIWVVEE